jgi:hypothetical protein
VKKRDQAQSGRERSGAQNEKPNSGEMFEEDGGIAGAAVGEEGVVGDDSDGGPAEAAVEAFGGGAGDGIENEEGFFSGEGGAFGVEHEQGGDSSAAGGAMDEEFGDVGAVGLVGRRGEEDLDGSDEHGGGGRARDRSGGRGGVGSKIGRRRRRGRGGVRSEGGDGVVVGEE